MPRQEIHTDDIKIDQKAPIIDHKKYEGEIIRADAGLLNKDYQDELAFMDEPVTIRMEPSTDRNAINVFPVWVNGKGAEVFQNNCWVEVTYLPVGQVLTIKRKYLEVIMRAKIDTVHTEVREKDSETPNNAIQRLTSAVHSLSIIEDKNPMGVAWLTEVRRRNM